MVACDHSVSSGCARRQQLCATRHHLYTIVANYDICIASVVTVDFSITCYTLSRIVKCLHSPLLICCDAPSIQGFLRRSFSTNSSTLRRSFQSSSSSEAMLLRAPLRSKQVVVLCLSHSPLVRLNYNLLNCAQT